MLENEKAMTDESVKMEQTGFARFLAVATITSAIIVAVALAVAFAKIAFLMFSDDNFIKDLIRDHFKFVVGLPGSAYSAYVIVVLLRQADGPIEFEALGLKLKGAAGQVLMWILCFMTFVSAIHILW
jgi:hypothetical protein